MERIARDGAVVEVEVEGQGEECGDECRKFIDRVSMLFAFGGDCVDCESQCRVLW